MLYFFLYVNPNKEDWIKDDKSTISDNESESWQWWDETYPGGRMWWPVTYSSVMMCWPNVSWNPTLDLAKFSGSKSARFDISSISPRLLRQRPELSWAGVRNTRIQAPPPPGSGRGPAGKGCSEQMSETGSHPTIKPGLKHTSTRMKCSRPGHNMNCLSHFIKT